MNFYEILILIIAGVIAIRFTFKFDLNKYLENRRRIKLDQLKNICPHGKITKINGKFGFESFFSSPVGTLKYICSQCNAIVNSKEDAIKVSQNYIENPDLFFKKQKKFIKKAKKLKII